jgi:phage tail sheath protein FI
VIDSLGCYYESAPTVEAPAPSPGEAATYTATIAENGANPVCAYLTPVLNQLIAHAIVESSGVSQQNDVDWRETFQSERLIPISGGCKVIDTESGAVVVRPLAPRIAGIAVRRDFEKGWPGHSWANQPIQGIVGRAREIDFNITDAANEGQELLEANIGIVARGEMGNEFAVASGGFVFVGTDNAGEDELWRF